MFPSPLNKSPQFQGPAERSESLRLHIERDPEFPLHEEQIFKDSMASSPFAAPFPNSLFESKLSQAQPNCQTPRRSHAGPATSHQWQTTPMNPWNEYLVSRHAPSPIRFLRAGDSKTPLPGLSKSILGTPDIFQAREARRGINLQKLIFSGAKEPKSRLLSSAKKPRAGLHGSGAKPKANWRAPLWDAKAAAARTPGAEDKENALHAAPADGINAWKVRSSEIQYEPEFFRGGAGANLPQGLLGLSAKPSLFLQSHQEQLRKEAPAKQRPAALQKATALEELESVAKPKKLFEAEVGERNMLDNMQDFFEKSLSRLLKVTPGRGQPGKEVGMLFFNAINSIRADSRGARPGKGLLPPLRRSPFGVGTAAGDAGRSRLARVTADSLNSALNRSFKLSSLGSPAVPPRPAVPTRLVDPRLLTPQNYVSPQHRPGALSQLSKSHSKPSINQSKEHQRQKYISQTKSTKVALANTPENAFPLSAFADRLPCKGGTAFLREASILEKRSRLDSVRKALCGDWLHGSGRKENVGARKKKVKRL